MKSVTSSVMEMPRMRSDDEVMVESYGGERRVMVRSESSRTWEVMVFEVRNG